MAGGFTLFGVHFGREDEEREVASPVNPEVSDGAVSIVQAPGFISPQINAMQLDASARTEADYISKYREIAVVPEVSQCIEEIVSEAIVIDREKDTITLNLDELDDIPDSVKKKMEAAFDVIYKMLRFNRNGHDIFKRWYIDGRLNYFTLIDEKNPKEGIKGVRYIDPRKIKKIRELEQTVDQKTGAIVVVGTKEYFLFNERGLTQNLNSQQGLSSSPNPVTKDIPITKDSIIHCNSGLLDSNTNAILSYLHEALRPANNLRMMEDAMVIYRLARAPERRAFYIDTGNLPNMKAQQYVQEIANKFKNKIVYDINTGEIKNDRKFLAMTEDYWIPRKEGSRGTQIETLPGGEQVGETGESEWFRDKLYTAMKVPKSRFSDQPSMFSGGTQITRDELRFNRFINQLRSKFSTLFEELLGKQLVLTGVMSIEEWDDIKDGVRFDFAADNYFAEALDSEVMNNRANLLTMLDPFVGKYISYEYVYKNILRMSEEEMKSEQKFLEDDQKKAQAHTAAQSAAESGIDPEDPNAYGQAPEPVKEELDTTLVEDELSNALVEYLKKRE